MHTIAGVEAPTRPRPTFFGQPSRVAVWDVTDCNKLTARHLSRVGISALFVDGGTYPTNPQPQRQPVTYEYSSTYDKPVLEQLLYVDPAAVSRLVQKPS